MMARPLRILSNMRDLGQHAGPGVQHDLIDDANAWSIFRRSRHYPVLLLNCNESYLWPLLLLRWLWPFGRCKLVSLDIQLVKPRGWKQRMVARVRRWLLHRVDHFVHYFKDLEGYRRHYGIGPERSTYVPFKVNGWDQIADATELDDDGDYVLTCGRSLRDLDTFAEAMRLLDHPGILLYFHDPRRLERDGTALPQNLPANVRAVPHDGGSESWLAHFRRARVVVVPILPSCIRSCGISTYLDAMALKKCVVITEGAATRHVLHDEVVTVPAGDPEALANAIDRCWRDAALRQRVATAGHAYARRVGGTPRLVADLVGICARITGKSAADQPAAAPPEVSGKRTQWAGDELGERIPAQAAGSTSRAEGV